jgi:nitrogen regulatory protein PII
LRYFKVILDNGNTYPFLIWAYNEKRVVNIITTAHEKRYVIKSVIPTNRTTKLGEGFIMYKTKYAQIINEISLPF